MPNCPSCGEENPERAKFCLECGTPLAEPATLPGTEERKVVTVLFCDLVGFTSRSDKADPEDVRATIRPYHAMLRSEIEGYGGTVEKFIGDAVMAVFGAPVAHEDDAERAVRAGLRILESIGEMNEEREGLDLVVRIGIETGEAVVALSARPDLGEGIVTGDVVNTASRLQGAAPVGGVAVGEGTYRSTKDVFDYEVLDPVEVKGKADPIPIWRATAARARFGSELTRRHTVAMVGREVERGILQGLFERAARGRSVQLVTLVGEPGVGKSRLVFELETYIEERTDLVIWRQGRCLPYGEGITFWALGEIVKHEAGILETDSPEEAAAKLDRAIRSPDAQRDWLRSRLAPLVGAGGAAPADRDEAFTAWRRFLEGIVADRPGVFVFEDLHWADPALLEFLEHLAEWSEGVPMLLVCTARPELYERHPTWAGGMRNATTISLDPLSDEETARLVGELLDQTVLPADVQASILERAGGNPLYAEEFVRMLKDRGALVRHGATWELVDEEDVSAPEGVHALVAARLDTLVPDRKGLLRDAAVLGRVFWSGAVAEMSGRDEDEVRAALHELGRKELVRQLRDSSMADETEYTFWHMVVRDVAYQQIPRADRVEKHLAAGAWIEHRAGDRVEDLAEVIAHHYDRAFELAEVTGRVTGDLRDRALRFTMLAADRASGLDAQRASKLFDRALLLASDDHPDRARVLEGWGKTTFQLARSSEAFAAIEEAIRLYESNDQILESVRAQVLLSACRRDQGGSGDDRAIVRALQMLEPLPPGPELVDAYAERASLEYTRGNDQEAAQWADRSLVLASELGIPKSATALGVLGGATASLGDPRGLDTMRHGIRLALERGDGRRAAMGLNNLAVELMTAAGPREAVLAFEEGIEIAEQRGIRASELWTRASSLQSRFDLGLWDQVQADSGRLRAIPSWGVDSAIRTQVLAIEIRILNGRGDRERTRSLAGDARELAQAMRETPTTVDVFSALAEAWLGAGDRERAIDALRQITADPLAPASWNLPLFLPEIVRTAVRVDPTIAREITAYIDPRSPVRARALPPAHAIIAEAEGDLERATDLYARAAEDFAAGGWMYEEAIALLGRGRCLVALGRDGTEPLGRARAFFAGVGAVPYLAETDGLLDGGVALSS